MKTIYALTDYRNHFGNKWNAIPYRSGYNKKYLYSLFQKYGYELNYIQFKNVIFSDNWKDENVIYTSSEEYGLNYKDFIEDIILGLEKLGAHLIPKYDFLRAHENKVYMNILKKCLLGKELSLNSSFAFGTYEEIKQTIKEGEINYPVVIKKSTGAMSKNVYLARNKEELLKHAKKIGRTPNLSKEIKEIVREKKYKRYKKESKYQNKFIVQSYIPDLKNDWKVLIYGDHYYILNRGIRPGDFRASGSHYDYRAGSKSQFPLHMLDKLQNIYNKCDVPNLSVDFAYDGKSGYILELQAVYFGTSTIEFSNDYFTKENGEWVVKKKNMDQEEEYVYSIIQYLKRMNRDRQ